MQREIADNRIWFGRDGNGVPRIKTYLDAKDRGLTPESILFASDVATNEIAKNSLKELFNGKSVFETPKPIDLIKLLVQLSAEDGIVLDFFAGSCVTAHATMDLNIEDGGTRRFIVVQLPEACDLESEAYKEGFKTIADIGKERIRRAGQKIKQDNSDNPNIAKLDIGFRVLKIDTSNMKEVYYTPDAVTQEALPGLVDNIREDRSAEDLLFQVLLDWGVDLALPISQQTIAGKTVFFVDGNALAACFETGIAEDFVKQLAAHKPLRVVFRDSGFVSDSVKINVEQVFKLLSPATEIKTL
jgi:adenine-specific DNA-methyltransferase